MSRALEWVVEVRVQGEGQATGAVRLVEHWYRHHIVIIVEERRQGPRS